MKKTIGIIIGICVFIIIGIVTFIFLTKKGNTDKDDSHVEEQTKEKGSKVNNPNKDVNEFEKTSEDYNLTLSGVYSFNKSSIHVYQLMKNESNDLSDSILILAISKEQDNETVNSGNYSTAIFKMSELNNNTINWENLGVTYTFTFKNDLITVSKKKSSPEKYHFDSGSYTKVNDYSISDLYEEFFNGDKTLFSTSEYMLSAHMVNTSDNRNPDGNRKLVMYQTNEDEVQINLCVQNGTSKTFETTDKNDNGGFFCYNSCHTKIQEDGSLLEEEREDGSCIVKKIKVDGVEGFSVNVGSNSWNENGFYAIDQKMTLNDLIYDRFGKYF